MVLGKFESGITIKHDETDIGTDGRLWKVTKSGVEYLFIIKYCTIADDGAPADGYYILKSVDAGENWTKTSVLDFNDTNNATVCIDRDVEYAYILYQRSFFNEIYVQTITINGMSVNTPVEITRLTGAIPLQAFVTNQGDKIVWLGDNKTLYKMDLDGTNIENITFTFYNTTPLALGFSSSNYAYVVGDSVIVKVNTTTMDIATSSGIPSLFVSGIDVSNIFCYNGYVYLVAAVSGNPNGRLLKIAESDLSDQTDVDIRTIYDIEYDTVKGFFPYTENCTKKALLVENNGEDRLQVWEVDLDILSMKVLYQLSIEKISTITTAICEFANSGAIIQKVIADCQRSDPSGDIWAEIFST